MGAPKILRRPDRELVLGSDLKFGWGGVLDHLSAFGVMRHPPTPSVLGDTTPTQAHTPVVLASLVAWSLEGPPFGSGRRPFRSASSSA